MPIERLYLERMHRLRDGVQRALVGVLCLCEVVLLVAEAVKRLPQRLLLRRIGGEGHLLLQLSLLCLQLADLPPDGTTATRHK